MRTVKQVTFSFVRVVIVFIVAQTSFGSAPSTTPAKARLPKKVSRAPRAVRTALSLHLGVMPFCT